KDKVPFRHNDIAITGKVTDDKNEPLIGVTVRVKGSNSGVTTDGNGAFSIQVPEANAIITFSYLGYQPLELRVNGRNVLDVVMRPSENALTEVVVVGYGTQKKVNLTGSVASVSSADIENRPIT